MHVGSHGNGHAVGQYRMTERAQMMHRAMAADGPTRGEKIVARLDRDDDGKLSIAELKDSKMGRHMSVDRFARMDGNNDGMLESAELDAGRRRGHRHGPGAMENVLNTQFADYLAEKVEITDDQTDVASLILEQLDEDQSGGLNSEEIAGTRLAKLIGGDFYQLDVDKNGALNKAELSSFITDHLLGDSDETNPEIAVEVVADNEIPSGETRTLVAVAPGEPDTWTSASETDAANSATQVSDLDQPVTVNPTPSLAAARDQSIASAFKIALETLQNGSGSDSAYDVVQTLYGNVQKILQSS